jgi:hypothetical protein
VYRKEKAMPWDVKKDGRCPGERPWGVVTQGSNNLRGCHPSKIAAETQQRALYANVKERGASGQRDEKQ